MSPMIQPLPFTGLSPESYAQLSLNPNLFTLLSASDGQHRHGRRLRDGHSDAVEGEEQERLQWLRQEEEEQLAVLTEPRQRTAKFQEGPYLKSGDNKEQESLDDVGKDVQGRKASKKHKRK